jgi:hypothetical protein
LKSAGQPSVSLCFLKRNDRDLAFFLEKTEKLIQFGAVQRMHTKAEGHRTVSVAKARQV